MKFEVRSVREGVTRVDWDRRLLIVRKPAYHGVSLPYVQAKRDGIRVVCARQCTKLGSVFTTQGLDLAEQYKLFGCKWYDHVMAICGSHHVDAELHAPDKGREAVKTALKEDPDSIRLAVFGCGHVPPRAPLSEVQAWCEEIGLLFLPWSDACDEIFQCLVDADPQYDGFVCKDTHYGKWVKVKKERTVDCVVVRVQPGSGKYWGQCGALVVAVVAEGKFGQPIWREIARVSGMDDEVRAAIPLNLSGRVCEVKYERMGSQGRLQHPRFIRWRDDKASEDCTEDQLDLA